MASSYQRRLDALEEVLGAGVCPPEGCGRCLVLGLLAGMRGTDLPRCNNQPGTVADALNQLSFDDRRALRVTLEAEVDRRRSAATDLADAGASHAMAGEDQARDSVAPLDWAVDGRRQGDVES